MDRQEILNQLRAFPYDRNEYWVVTGAAMVLYGFKEQTGDIDLGCSKKLADLLEAKHEQEKKLPKTHFFESVFTQLQNIKKP